MKISVIIAISVLILGISFTSISAQSQIDIPSWVKNNAIWWGEGQISDSEFLSAIEFLINEGFLKIGNSSEDSKELQQKLESMTNLKDKYQQSMIKLKNENEELQDEIVHLKSEVNRLSKTIDNLASVSASSSNPSTSNNISTYEEIRYDIDDTLNIGGLTVDIHSLGFLEPKPDEFSIDMSLRYTRGGSAVGFDVAQIRVTTDDNFSYEANVSEFTKFNGHYLEDTENRGIVKVEGVPRNFDENDDHMSSEGKDLTILVLVQEFENNYYIQDYIFTFDYSLCSGWNCP